ncbi:MAG: ATP phosphoribosyltransferase regulatory subunit [Dehalococcoidia bacterium]
MSTSSTISAARSRGMRDWLPADMRAFRRVVDSFRQVASHWGYEEIRTPTIETYSLFTAARGLTPQMLSRVYSFLDWDGWSGERVVLRPDSTIPVARAAADAGLPLPARLYYVQNVFRFSETDDREDWQCGIEYLGAPPTVGDLEVVVVACETIESLGLEPRVRLGHAGIARAVATSALAASNGDLAAIIDRVQAEGLAALKPDVAGDAAVTAFLEVALRRSTDVALLGNLKAIAAASLPGALAAIEAVEAVAAPLAGSGRPILIDLGMPRDFAYYTGVVFEFEADGLSWGKGGRYTPGGDGVAGTACGAGLDLELLAGRIRPQTHARNPVTIVPEGAGDMAKAMSVARALHRSGVAASLGAELAADSLNVRVMGDRLVAHTPQGEQAMASLDDLVGLLVQHK